MKLNLKDLRETVLGGFSPSVKLFYLSDLGWSGPPEWFPLSWGVPEDAEVLAVAEVNR